MSNSEHKIDKNFLHLHKRTGGTEGGACLTRHITRVSRSSCSHRWQARERAANEDKSYYNGIKPGWDVTGSTNFWKWTTPYPHHAHHILPNGVLSSTILESAQAAESLALYNLIRMGLLQAEYNLNHKSNMIILPLDTRVASILKLPRHLRSNEQSHEAYSAIVKAEVQPVINSYAKLIQDSRKNKGHPPAPDKLSKAKLMRVSAKMRARILTWGRAVPGPALEDHSPKKD